MVDVCNILIKEKDGYKESKKMVWDTAEAKTVWQLKEGGHEPCGANLMPSQSLQGHSIWRTCTRDSDHCRAFSATCRFWAWCL